MGPQAAQWRLTGIFSNQRAMGKKIFDCREPTRRVTATNQLAKLIWWTERLRARREISGQSRRKRRVESTTSPLAKAALGHLQRDTRNLVRLLLVHARLLWDTDKRAALRS